MLHDLANRGGIPAVVSPLVSRVIKVYRADIFPCDTAADYLGVMLLGFAILPPPDCAVKAKEAMTDGEMALLPNHCLLSRSGMESVRVPKAYIPAS